MEVKMKVNVHRIKAERTRRAWSQEHLAEAAGLGLRTVHRIENSGNASLESIKALAAVFELEIDEITESKTENSNREVPKTAIWVMTLYAWLVAANFGAALLDAVYARLLTSLSSDYHSVFSAIADSLLFLFFLSFLACLAALFVTWQIRLSRVLLLTNLALSLGVPLIVALFIDVTIDTSTWGVWLRIMLGLVTVVLAFSAQWYVIRHKPSDMVVTV